MRRHGGPPDANVNERLADEVTAAGPVSRRKTVKVFDRPGGHGSKEPGIECRRPQYGASSRNMMPAPVAIITSSAAGSRLIAPARFSLVKALDNRHAPGDAASSGGGRASVPGGPPVPAQGALVG
jgi:hypothetical protein